jgi:hypothetical protein
LLTAILTEIGKGFQEKNICYKVVGTNQYFSISFERFIIQGRPHFVFVLKDLGEFRKYHKLKEDKKQNLIQLASIVHDLKTPLSCIQGTSFIIKEAV